VFTELLLQLWTFSAFRRHENAHHSGNVNAKNKNKKKKNCFGHHYSAAPSQCLFLDVEATISVRVYKLKTYGYTYQNTAVEETGKPQLASDGCTDQLEFKPRPNLMAFVVVAAVGRTLNSNLF
jgi:hypothetical protein